MNKAIGGGRSLLLTWKLALYTQGGKSIYGAAVINNGRVIGGGSQMEQAAGADAKQ